MRPSLRRLIVRERFHPNALGNARRGPRLGRVKGSLRRCAPLTRPARSRVGSIYRSDEVMTTPQLRLPNVRE
jgi:hypothetical protein